VQCPYCGADSNVTETRVTADGLRRRRLCGACKRRFTTYEKVGAPGLRVAKRDGTIEPFDGDKLFGALRRVARHRAGLRDEDLRRVARDIEASLVDAGRKAVTWRDIVGAALQRLEALDPIAARRLAANYVDDQGDVRLDGAAPPTSTSQLPLPGVDDE
jgi:transcriptional repressor NrdR